MSEAEFSFTPNAAPIIELGLGDTRVPAGTGVWDTAQWDDPGAVWQGLEPAWWDVSCFAIEAEIARGRERATDRFVAGTAGVVLNNEDGWADMAGSPESIAAVSLRPGRAVRIGVNVATLGKVWLFRGVIDRVTPTYDPVHLDYVKLDCIDLLGEVGHVKLVGGNPVGGDDTVTQRINRLLDACKHPAEKRSIASDGTRLIQTSYDAQAIDLLGQAADSAGGIVYGDELGNIVYKPYGWQAYLSTAVGDGAIGNIVGGTPDIPAITPPAYAQTGSGVPVTTPDAFSIALPNSFTVFTTVRVSAGATGTGVLCGQWATGQLEWMITRNNTSGVWTFVTSADGSTSISAPFTAAPTPPTYGTDETWALSVQRNNGSGQTVLTAYVRQGGSDLNPLWFAAGPTRLVAQMPWVDRTSPISIGGATGTAPTWAGRIYDVELAIPQTPTPKGATIWRFDADDSPAVGTSWTDPRGRVWTAAAELVHPPTIPPVPGTPGDICPAGWEVSYDRMDLATAVELNRQLPTPVPRLRYTLDSSTAANPTSGTLRLDNTDQQAATYLRVHVTSADGLNAEPFLRNIVTGTEIRLSDVGDVTNNTRAYVTPTGAGPINGTNGRYYLMAITWIDGLTAIGGIVDMVVEFIPPPAYVIEDDIAQAIYGTEVWSMTDLVSIDGSLFPKLAERALATRGHRAMPRLEAVTLDAKASRGQLAALEMMATCRPERPSRYMCRLRHEDGRVIFNRNMFAVGTRHFLARNEWTLRIALDDAEWAANPNGEIHATENPDRAAIVGTVTATFVGPIVVTEAADTAAIVGTTSLGATGVVAATESADTSTVIGTIGVRGVIAANETVDVSTIVGTVT